MLDAVWRMRTAARASAGVFDKLRRGRSFLPPKLALTKRGQTNAAHGTGQWWFATGL